MTGPNKFSVRSEARLRTCHADLQRVFRTVLIYRDCTIIEGHRPEALQNEMFDLGKSKLRWPDSGHNDDPSRAVDAAPYPIDWHNWRQFDHFAGLVLGIGNMLDIPLRWGGDWDRNGNPVDQRFHDLPHFELVPGA